MNIKFYYFLLCILIPRLFYQWKDDEIIKIRHHVIIFIVESVLLFPLFSPASISVLLSLIIIYHLTVFMLEGNGKKLFIKRVIEIFIIVIISSFVFGTILNYIEFNSISVKVFKLILSNNAMLGDLNIELIKLYVFYLFGIVVLINEWNNLIRYILELIKTEPYREEGDNNKPDGKELGKGKIIGIIERILFFFFVITGNYSSIGFVLAAKGITRFKNLEDKDFAEYVLIGTLLSSSISIFWAYLIKQ